MQKGPYFNNVQYISPLPEGYLQAASNIGRTYENALRGVGDTIGASIEKYSKSKAESEMLDGQLQSIAPAIRSYAEQAVKSGDAKLAERWTNLADDVSSFHNAPLTKKRALVSGAMTEISLFEKGQEMAARQSQIRANELANARAQQEALNLDAYTAAIAGVPDTMTVQRPVSEDQITLRSTSDFINQNDPMVQGQNPNVNLGPAFSFSPSQNQLNAFAPTSANTQASVPDSLSRFAFVNPLKNSVELKIDAIRQFSESTEAGISKTQARLAQIRQALQRGTNEGRLLSGIDPMYTTSGEPMRSSERARLSEQYRNLESQLGQQMASAEQTRNLIKQAAALAANEPTSVRPAARSLPAAPGRFESSSMPSVGTERVTRIKDLEVNLTPEEQYANALTTYVEKGGKLNPATDKDLREKFGINPALRFKTESIKDEDGNVIGTAVIANNEIKSIMPTKESGMTPAQAIAFRENIDARTVRFGDRAFLAPTASEGEKFRAATASNEVVKEKVRELMSLASAPGVRVVGADAYNRAMSIQKQLRGLLRVELTGPGAVNASEYELMDQIIADPTALFSLESSTVTKLGELLNTTDQKLAAHAKSLGFQATSSGALASASSGQTAPPKSYVRDPKTGKITAQ